MTPLVLLANSLAILALVLMMLGVGLSIGAGLSTLPRSLDRRTAALCVVGNLFIVPGIIALVIVQLGLTGPAAIAALLLACFPAGPVSLLFVRQQAASLRSATAVVLLLQIVGVFLSPVLVIALTYVCLGRPLFGDPRATAVSISVQMILLELLPIFLGARWAQLGRVDATQLRLILRRIAGACLGGAGLAFGVIHAARIREHLLPALALSLTLLVVSLVSGVIFRGRLQKTDGAQIFGLRNISVALVVAGTSEALSESVLSVLVMASVMTATLPLLVLLRTSKHPDVAEAC